MVSVPTEEDRYNTIITTYPPSGVRVFNAARTALHTLQERIHFSWKAHHEASLGPQALGARS